MRCRPGRALAAGGSGGGWVSHSVPGTAEPAGGAHGAAVGGPHPPPPHVFQELIRATLTDMETQEERCQPLICEKSRPVPLKLFTPRLVKV